MNFIYLKQLLDSAPFCRFIRVRPRSIEAATYVGYPTDPLGAWTAYNSSITDFDALQLSTASWPLSCPSIKKWKGMLGILDIFCARENGKKNRSFIFRKIDFSQLLKPVNCTTREFGTE